ncbi:hypothetical protein PybrP1_007526 [[Pythium] brassicae (nom. inval.)]|nr:hypothetical protein PybrP1_007526 [[Pythium] brassicae (nom. inval.)]
MRQLVVLDKATDAVGVKRVDQLKDAWRERHGLESAGDIALSHGDARHDDVAGVEAILGNESDTFEDTRLSWFGQVGVLSARNAARIIRDKVGFQFGVVQTIFISLIIGLIYLQLEVTQSGTQNIAGAFFFIVANQTLTASSSAFVAVPLELPVVIREYHAGLYHLVTWYLSKNVSELPLQIVLPTLFFVPVYLLVGINQGVEAFFHMLLVVFLFNSCGLGLGYMVSCLCRRADLAPVVGIAVTLPLMVFGGVFLNSADTPSYFLWVQYLSPIKYGFEALMKIYWKRVALIPCDEAIENCIARTGAQVLQNYNMLGHSAFHDAMLLIILNVGFRTVGFLGLWISLRVSK